MRRTRDDGVSCMATQGPGSWSLIKGTLEQQWTWNGQGISRRRSGGVSCCSGRELPGVGVTVNVCRRDAWAEMCGSGENAKDVPL
jgi:hypothetical protein